MATPPRPFRLVTRLSDSWSWDDVGRQFARALLDAGFPTRILGSTLGDLSDPVWDSVREAFPHVTGLGKSDISSMDLEGDWINFVVGFDSDFKRFHTAGHKNVAYTACCPQAPSTGALATLETYDLILVHPTDLWIFQAALPEKRVESCKPLPHTLKFVLERAFDENRL